MVLTLRDGALPPCGICVEGSIVQPCSILHLGMQIAKSCKYQILFFYLHQSAASAGVTALGVRKKSSLPRLRALIYYS